MEPKDLKNSEEELKATPAKTGEADTPIEKKDKGVEEVKTPKVETEVEESVAESKEDEVNDETVEVKTDAAVEIKPEAEVVDEKVEDVVEEEVIDEVEEKPVEAKAEEEKAEEEVEEPVDKEEEAAPEVVVTESIDYSSMSEVELINALRALVEGSDDEYIKDEVDKIKINFYKKHRANVEAEKKKYLEEGGDEAEFVPENQPYEEDLKNLLKEYRKVKTDYAKKQESEKEDNLKRKYEIIEEIRNLVNRDESINKTFHEFRDLQQEWREIGLVPQAKLKDLWETYHHHVENFYDYIKINKELRDLDLKKNQEAKIGLCEKAEELLVEPSIIKAFNILQKYHEQWREIGPVPRDKKEELWERFKAATSQINKKHQEYFENRKSEQKKNLEAKTVLCEKAEEIANKDMSSNKDWEVRSKELIELQKVWRTIGFAPKKDNNRIYERFRTACDKFFDRKREFYSQNKELQMNNLQMKTDLCVQAESLKDSTDWRKTTDEYIRIQRKWKEIGPVPRKHSDVVWKRFRAACDYFFEKKSEHFSHVDDEQIDNLKLKKELIEEVKAYVLTKDDVEDLDQMKEFQRRWSEIGHVPFKDKDKVQNDFRDAINIHFDNLKLDDQKRNLLKFRNKIVNISGTSRGQNKMRFEREKYVSKLKQLESDLALLNNNIGFFANTKNAEAMIEDVNKKIELTHEKIELLKEKIQIIDNMDEEE
ncbi:DUF349 domain-containing protein [Sunxiuqinia sp. A32]|uniref:DUF349 domain-containing protein n=1 Tax=Sunxiuqinia sp. A32 TaxID=3461496 RepID=UPI0040460D63